jgi:hypothetical protein
MEILRQNLCCPHCGDIFGKAESGLQTQSDANILNFLVNVLCQKCGKGMILQGSSQDVIEVSVCCPKHGHMWKTVSEGVDEALYEICSLCSANRTVRVISKG